MGNKKVAVCGCMYACRSTRTCSNIHPYVCSCMHLYITRCTYAPVRKIISALKCRLQDRLKVRKLSLWCFCECCSVFLHTSSEIGYDVVLRLSEAEDSILPAFEEKSHSPKSSCIALIASHRLTRMAHLSKLA